jgi:hypothetical protein
VRNKVEAFALARKLAADPRRKGLETPSIVELNKGGEYLIIVPCYVRPAPEPTLRPRRLDRKLTTKKRRK